MIIKLEAKVSANDQQIVDLNGEIDALKTKAATEKDKIYGELIKIKEENSVLIAEKQRSEASYHRILSEMETYQLQFVTNQEESAKLKVKLDEQVLVNIQISASLQKANLVKAELQDQIEHLKQDLLISSTQASKSFYRDLESENKELAAKVATLILEKESLVQLQKNVDGACQSAVKEKTALKQSNNLLLLEKENLERKLEQALRQKGTDQRKDTEKEEAFIHNAGELKMLKITIESKEAAILALTERVKAYEINILKQQELKSVQNESLQELESRIRRLTQQTIELGQDNRLWKTNADCYKMTWLI